MLKCALKPQCLVFQATKTKQVKMTPDETFLRPSVQMQTFHFAPHPVSLLGRKHTHCTSAKGKPRSALVS